MDATEWFKQEVHPHEGQLKSWLRGAYRVRDVDDIVQESYLRIWKAKAAHPIQSAKSFLFQIARNLSINILRREKTARLDPLGDLAAMAVIDDRPNAAEALSAQEKLELLTDAVVALPPRCREVIILHKIKGLSQRDVAFRLRLSERTVENHCQRGLVKCAEYLRARGIEGFQIK